MSPFDVILPDDQVLQPDVMFIRSEWLGILAGHGVLGAPDLVVEVLSPSSRPYDLGRKRELYHRHGSLELWIVDLLEQALLFHVRGEAGWQWTRLTRGDVLLSHVVPDFRLQVSDVVTAGALPQPH